MNDDIPLHDVMLIWDHDIGCDAEGQNPQGYDVPQARVISMSTGKDDQK